MMARGFEKEECRKTLFFPLEGRGAREKREEVFPAIVLPLMLQILMTP
jgi:hypothetical protein